MSRVLERRRELLKIIRQFTLDAGSVTVNELADAAGVPRSTAQDWISRLIEERCVVQKEDARGRQPARYAAASAVPSSACRRIFTTIDGDHVEIYHECMSAGCAAFCEFHHRLAKGALDRVERDGVLLRECARIGTVDLEIGLYPHAAVGIRGLSRSGDCIVQHIRCIGGPAYSLTDMMSDAKGVCDVRVHRAGHVVEGEIYTRALAYLAIGIDDTDARDQGATFAVALALLQHLGALEGVIPIGHHVVMLYPRLPAKTAGNSCSYIEMAVEPKLVPRILEKAERFISDESLSPNWGIAAKTGFTVPPALRAFGNAARRGVVTKREAEETAASFGIRIAGGTGVIGALAAVALRGVPRDILLDPGRDVLY